jgi:hypothetical protein
MPHSALLRTLVVHPTALITSACLALAFGSALQCSNPLQWVHVVATALMVSPLLLLLWSHHRLASTWRQHAWLAFCAVPLAYIAYFAAFLMAWFKPGWYGVIIFTAVLLALCGLSLLPLRRKKVAKLAA